MASDGRPGARADAEHVFVSTWAVLRRLAAADHIGRNGLDARDDIADLNLATVPSVLVECANLRNTADAATARSAAGQQRCADAPAEAVTERLAGPRR